MSPKYTNEELKALRKQMETKEKHKDDSKRNKRDKKNKDINKDR